MVGFHIGDGRILEMFLRAEDSLGSVRMVREKRGKHSLVHLAVILRKGHVLFLIDGFKFRVESADYRVLEAIRLHSRPVLNLV